MLRTLRLVLTSLAFYLTSAVLMTWPLISRLTTHIPGTGGDLWVHWWNFWWLKRVWTRGGPLFHTDLLFYPQGLSLTYHNIAWLQGLMWLPLQAAVGGIPAYGLVFLLTLALNGVGMFFLARELTRSNGAAWIAGLVYAFWPYTLSHFNHTNMIAVQWVPWVVLGLRRVVRRGRWGDALFTALFLFLTGLARWHHLFYGGVVWGVFLLWSLLTERHRWKRRTVGLLALAGLLAGLALLPLALPLLSSQLTREHPEDIFVQEQREGQTDLLAYGVPNRSHPVWGSYFRPIYERFDVNRDEIAYLGYVAVALMIYGLVRRWRRARFWLLAAVVIWMMALGANLRVAGHVYPNLPTPYRLVGELPFVKIWRQPDRFNIVLGLPVAMLVGWGVEAVLAARPRKQTWIAVGLGGLILLDYIAIPYATVAPDVPVWYRHLAAQEGDWAILPVPMGVGNSKEHMLYQTVHAKPTVTGETARPPREAFDFIRANPLLRGISQTSEFDPALRDTSRQLSRLAEAGIRYLVLHPQMESAKRVARWQDWLTVRPAYQDERTIVYPTFLEYGRDFDFVAELGDGLGLIDGTLSTNTLAQEGLLEADLRWGSQAAPTQDWLVRLALVSATGQVAQAAEGELCAGWPTSNWGANAVARGQAALQVDPFIQGGTYTVTLRLVDPVSGREMGRAAELGQVVVQAVARVFTLPEPEMPLDVDFGDDLRLLGYDLRQSRRELQLTLHWQAQSRMEVAYKLFVHLFNVQTGELAAQVDTMPRDWGYPTHWWEAQEVVSDEIRLSLSDLPPAEYRLVVGVYDPGSGERLWVWPDEGQSEPADRLILQEVSLP